MQVFSSARRMCGRLASGRLSKDMRSIAYTVALCWHLDSVNGLGEKESAPERLFLPFVYHFA